MVVARVLVVAMGEVSMVGEEDDMGGRGIVDWEKVISEEVVG